MLKLLPILLLFIFFACKHSDKVNENKTNGESSDYFNFKTEGKFQAAGVQMIELKEGHKVWTKRIGNNPKIKVLLLHGGPALTHEYMECFESFFPQAGIEFYHYDQLGSYYSDQPENDSLWTVDRFVEELEQVRIKLGLNSDNFFILACTMPLIPVKLRTRAQS
jgi:proline iminopeptidase